MPRFYYRGYDQTGAEEKGNIDTQTERIAFETLQSRGITVVELSQDESHQNATPWYRRDIRIRPLRLPYEDQAEIAKLLATLFSAGLPGSEVIRIAALSTERPEVRRQFERTSHRISDGASIAEAFEAENRIFSDLFISFLRVGDTTNRAVELLSSLSGFLERQSRTRQAIVSSLIYPAILFLAAIALLAIVTLYLAPNLSPIFSSLNKTPPMFLAVLLELDALLRAWWLVIAVGAVGAVIAMGAVLQTKMGMAVGRRVLESLPVLGRTIHLSMLARLTETVTLFLSAGETLPFALRHAPKTMGSSPQLTVLFTSAAEAVESGKSAASVLDASPEVPNGFKELFRVGESMNRLPSTLRAAATAMSDQAERRRQRLLVLLTPTITLVFGLGIGLLVYAIMNAMLEVNQIAF